MCYTKLRDISEDKNIKEIKQYCRIFLVVKITRIILVRLEDFRDQIRNGVLQKMKPTSQQLIQDVGLLSGIVRNQ